MKRNYGLTKHFLMDGDYFVLLGHEARHVFLLAPSRPKGSGLNTHLRESGSPLRKPLLTQSVRKLMYGTQPTCQQFS